MVIIRRAAPTDRFIGAAPLWWNEPISGGRIRSSSSATLLVSTTCRARVIDLLPLASAYVLSPGISSWSNAFFGTSSKISAHSIK
jgi:hypothetical protein